MLFAAGFGARMGSLTANRPKPLIPIAGRALIDHAMAVADAAGITCRVANTHYLGAQIAAHLAGRGVEISEERGRILDTGGGLRQALPLLDTNPVLTLNTDAVWTGDNPLTALIAAWDEAKMDGLLLVMPVHLAGGFNGPGDFVMSQNGQLRRANGVAGYAYLGAQMIRTDELAQIRGPAFSLNVLWDRMIAAGRAYGLVHAGGWYDVGRPDGIAGAEALIAGSSDV